jgi:hypothetical protein
MANILKFNQPLKLQSLTSDPSGPEAGLIYYNTTAHEFRVYDSNSAEWVALNKALADHPSSTSNPHSVTKDQVLSGDLIDNDDVSASAAIAESKLSLDVATSTLDTAISNHINDTSAAHAASAISADPAGIANSASTDVQGVLEDLDGAIAGSSHDPVTLAAGATQELLSLSTQELTANAATSSTAGYMSATDKDKLDNIEDGATADQNASEVSFSATGNIVATDVQAAIEELDSEKIASSEKGAANGVATLDASSKLPTSQLPVSATEYKGAWNASTNSPSLVDGTGTSGDMYRVSASGSQDLGSGAQSFVAGDAIIYDGSTWQKIPGDDQVLSVNGATGAVSLDTDDISEGSNLYFTDARAKAAAVADAINDGTTDVAPSQNAVFDALANKLENVSEDSSPSLGGDLDAGSNAIYSSSALKFGSSASDFYEEEYINSIILTDNTTAVASDLTYAAASFEGVLIEYKIKEASTNSVRVGKLMVANEPSSDVAIVDTYAETADLGVSFSAAFSGSNVEISYTCTSTGNNRTMRAIVKRIKA